MSSTPVVLDASAVLAMLRRERGAERVREALPGAAICAVNYAEVFAKLIDYAVDADAASDALRDLALSVEAFATEDAVAAGRLRVQTRSLGLSLGDRACLALATRLDRPALTTDAAWARLKIPALRIELIR